MMRAPLGRVLMLPIGGGQMGGWGGGVRERVRPLGGYMPEGHEVPRPRLINSPLFLPPLVLSNVILFPWEQQQAIFSGLGTPGQQSHCISK